MASIANCKRLPEGIHGGLLGHGVPSHPAMMLGFSMKKKRNQPLEYPHLWKPPYMVIDCQLRGLAPL